MKIITKSNTNIIKVFIANCIIIFLAAIYAYIRYSANNLPIPDGSIIFFLNKGLATTAAISISISYILSNLSKLKSINLNFNAYLKYFGTIGFILAALHIFVSLMLLNSIRFPYLFKTASVFNFYGEMTIFFGVISIGLFLMPAITSITSVKLAMGANSWKKYQQIGYFALLALIFHVYFANFFQTSNFSKSFAYLLPLHYFIWAIILTTLTLKAISIFKKKQTISEFPTEVQGKK